MRKRDLDALRTRFEGSSWAIWSEEFPRTDCPESDPERWTEFVQSHREELTPNVVFLSLNPSSEQPGNFRNFHSPKRKHYDDRLKTFIQEDRLEALHGGYMTDLVMDEVDSDSNQITPEAADVERFLDQLEFLGADQYHVISFSGKAFKALNEYFETSSHRSMPHDIRSFSVVWNGIRVHVYRVWFFGNWGANADKIPELRCQLAYLDGEVLG